MSLRKLAKDPESANGGCQTVYLDEDTGIEGEVELVVQGPVEELAAGRLDDVLEGESAVRIKASIVRAAMAETHGSTP